ncbi:MAG: hypothetical protein Q8922_03710 [Bacteroidota bacterium]|nr:hypothetical protein [Bacteroidota bacterium]MDP4233399.1 hypothetical protein [Bacteroidota bacterium]MDP4242265.1 hypothetical protein [Bacteroidota bacterium]MDP4287021.1 hypothetical protein [Bacteroidota bacterium]
MRSFEVILLVLLCFGSPSRAQDSARFARLGYVIGASVAFSLADYVGYSLARVDNVNGHAPIWYRLIESSVQAGMSYLLYEKFGLPSTIAFNLIWWTWGDDLGYYGWANALNPGKQSVGVWENREGNGLRSNHITWASWTPIGVLRPPGSLIARDALIAQAMVGFSVSMAILW